MLPFKTVYSGLAGVVQVPRASHLHHVAVKPDKTPCDIKITGGIACIHQPARYEHTATVPQFKWTTFSNTTGGWRCYIIHTAPDVKEMVTKTTQHLTIEFRGWQVQLKSESLALRFKIHKSIVGRMWNLVSKRHGRTNWGTWRWSSDNNW